MVLLRIALAPVEALEEGRYDAVVAQTVKVNDAAAARRRAVAARLRGMFAEVAPDRSLVDELIADRRAEARSESGTAKSRRRRRGG